MAKPKTTLSPPEKQEESPAKPRKCRCECHCPHQDPVVLDSLPRMCEVIPFVEQILAKAPADTVGSWRPRLDFGDELYDPWTQVQWDRYYTFWKAASAAGLVPAHLVDAQLLLPSEWMLEDPPFSPLAMETALDFCGFKVLQPETEDIHRIIVTGLSDARGALKYFFECPGTMLEHTIRYVIPMWVKKAPTTPKVLGEIIATDLGMCLFYCLYAICEWSQVIDLFASLDWASVNIDLLVDLVKDPQSAHKHKEVPLCGLLLRLESMEAISAARLSDLHGEMIGRPSFSIEATYRHDWSGTKSSPEELRKRMRSLKDMEGCSAIDKALTRLCLPSLHSAVPFQIALLDFEQLLLEDPKSRQHIPDRLIRALSHHSLIVQVHLQLRKTIYTLSTLSADLEGQPTSWGRSHHDPRKIARDTIVGRMGAIYQALYRYGATMREERASALIWRLSFFNWGKYISFDPDTLHPTWDSQNTFFALDRIVCAGFGCPLPRLFDDPNQSSSVGKGMRWFRLVDSSESAEETEVTSAVATSEEGVEIPSSSGAAGKSDEQVSGHGPLCPAATNGNSKPYEEAYAGADHGVTETSESYDMGSSKIGASHRSNRGATQEHSAVPEDARPTPSESPPQPQPTRTEYVAEQAIQLGALYDNVRRVLVRSEKVQAGYIHQDLKGVYDPSSIIPLVGEDLRSFEKWFMMYGMDPSYFLSRATEDGSSASAPESARSPDIAKPEVTSRDVDGVDQTEFIGPYMVSPKQLKVAERIFGSRDGDVPWNKLISLLEQTGIQTKRIGPALFSLRKPSEDGYGRAILLHRPFPDGKLNYEQAKSAGQQLSRAFNLSQASYERSAGSPMDADTA